MLTTMAAAYGWLPEEADLTAFEIRPFYLVARPGFWGGFGSFVDIFSPQGWNYVGNFRSLEEVNIVSSYADWCMVGHDMREAMIESHPTAA
jgi:hypothetical protein